MTISVLRKNFSFADLWRDKHLEQVGILAEFMQCPLQVFQWYAQGEEGFGVDPAVGDRGF